MIRRFVQFACAVALLLGPRVAAQSCDGVSPWHFRIDIACEKRDSSGLCPPDTRVGITLGSWQNDGSTSCATVEWDIGEGVPFTLNGAMPIVHTYAIAGVYDIVARITTPSSPHPRTLSTTVSIANGALYWQDVTVREGSVAKVLVTRSNTALATTLAWSVKDAPAELSPSAGTVSFAPGQASATIEIATVSDSTYKNPRTYQLVGTASGGFHAPSAATILVEDDDGSVISLAERGDIHVPEDAGTATIVVNRGGDITTPIAVSYEVWGYEADVRRTAGTLLFLAGETSRTFGVEIVDNAIWDSQPRQAWLRLESHDASARFTDGRYEHTTYIFLDDDEGPPTLSVADVAVVEGDEGRTDIVFTIHATPPVPGHLYLRVMPEITGGTAIRNTDYFVSSGSLVVSGSQATVRVTVVGDRTVEDDEWFELTLRSTSSSIAMPPPARGTIINDDVGFGPNRLRIPVGESRTALVNLGAPLETPLVIPLTNSRPDLAQVPASITIPAGSAAARFQVKGLVPDPSTFRLSADVPADRGGTLTISARVFAPRRVTFDPAVVTAFAGQKVPVRVTVSPPTGDESDLPLEMIDANVATAPSHVTIGTDGTGTFEITALSKGSTLLQARTPDDADELVTLQIEVGNAPDAPSLVSISPATGPAAGGTSFLALGSRLTADCTLSFGGIPVSGTALNADGAIEGTTPPHAPGTVDVALSCGGANYILTNGFTYLASPPVLQSITPTFGTTAGGTLVRATGSNFQSGCWMFFDGVPATRVDVDSTESLTASTPARVTGGIVDTVIRCGDFRAPLPDSYAYSGATEATASVVSVSPLIGAPGESVSITGSRFRADDAIRFDDAPATILRTRSDEHVVRIPELPLGTSSITLNDAAGRLTTTGPIFMIVEPVPPQIAAVTPATTLAGSDVTLHGRGFRPAYSFSIGGTAAQTIALSFDRVVVRVAPSVTPGDHRVLVVNAAGQVAAVGAPVTVRAGNLRVRNASPACGTTDGGMVVTLTGSGFASGATVTFNGIAATHVSVLSESELVATTPPNATGTAVIVAANADGDKTTSTSIFRYFSPFDPNGRCGESKSRAVRH